MKHFEIEILDQDKFIKNNNLKEITNPVMFSPLGGPSSDGLLSNEIFGITKDERAGIFAYIKLNGKFIEPYLYKVWLKIDKNLRSLIYETKNFKINSSGQLVEDENGETGLDFLYKNIDKIKFKQSKKDALLKVLMDNKYKMFTDSFIVIPPFYRDVNTTSSGNVGVGEINKLYITLINTVKALKQSSDYGLITGGGTKGRIQDIMLEIYNWYTMGESIIGGEHTGSGIFKKFGIMQRSNLSKTTDYGARLVLSSANIDVDSVDDLMVNLDYSAIPLSASCTIAYPFMIYQLRQWFNNEFGGRSYFNYIDKSGKVNQVELYNPEIEFSDDRFDKEIDEFIHGYSNRFKPVKVPNTENKDITLRFKGYNITPEQYASGVRENGNIIERDLTWMDILYICAVEATEDKMILITRYPVDSYFNQFSTKMRVLSTVETEPVVINGKLYPWYPKIRQKDIGTNTSNIFIDTCNVANPYCGLMNADFDGDQVTVKCQYTVESNKELNNFANSPGQFIKLNGICGRCNEKEAIQAMYNLTLTVPSQYKLTDPEF